VEIYRQPDIPDFATQEALGLSDELYQRFLEFSRHSEDEWPEDFIEYLDAVFARNSGKGEARIVAMAIADMVEGTTRRTGVMPPTSRLRPSPMRDPHGFDYR